MPYTNGQDTPKWIYRIDSRPPEVIFEQGFSPWGESYDFFQHVLGYSLSDDLPVSERSIFVSASDSPNSALRFFGTLLHMPQHRDYYLYQIRATGDVYSATRTAVRMYDRLENNSLQFEEGDRAVAYEAIDAVFTSFAYQREWFHVGHISNVLIHSAWRVDSVAIDPRHVRHSLVGNTYFTPRINDPEIMNPHFVDGNTRASNEPFDPYGNAITTPLTVSVPDFVFESDASGGVGASMGFACSLDPSPPPFVSAAANSQQAKHPTFKHCYFDQDLIIDDLRRKTTSVRSLSTTSVVVLMGSKSRKLFVMDWIHHQSYVLHLFPFKPNFGSHFIYDKYQRLSIPTPPTNLTLAATMFKTEDVTLATLKMDIATTNDNDQQFYFQRVDAGSGVEAWRFVSEAISHFSLHRNLVREDSVVYLRDYRQVSNYYEELLFIFDPDKTDVRMLLAQETHSHLVDLGLSWTWWNQNYVPIPETGYSRAAASVPKRFFYDLISKKILYINAKNQIFCLYNQRSLSYYWDWIRWMPSDLKSVSDPRQKWYFVNLEFKGNYNELSWRNVCSSFSNDWLRVLVRGVNWGAFYTTYSPVDKNSIAIFTFYGSVNL